MSNSDRIEGAQLALAAAVRILRSVADEAERFGNRDTSAFIHAAATIVDSIDAERVVLDDQ